MQKYASEFGFEIAGTIPFDAKLTDYDLDGIPFIDLPDDSEAVAELIGM